MNDLKAFVNGASAYTNKKIELAMAELLIERADRVILEGSTAAVGSGVILITGGLSPRVRDRRSFSP